MAKLVKGEASKYDAKKAAVQLIMANTSFTIPRIVANNIKIRAETIKTMSTILYCWIICI
jgi:transposase-like protein